MDNNFGYEESLYRAVYSPEVAAMFWRKNGSLSSAAFADPRGLSVERGYYRDDAEVVAAMHERFTGKIISFIVGAVWAVKAEIIYKPSMYNQYHSEVHGNKTEILLSKEQRYWLARYFVILD